MRAIDHNTITDAAIEQMAGTPDPRLREVMSSLVRHYMRSHGRLILHRRNGLKASNS